MLEIGNPGLNDDESQAQMSMWAMSPSPLLAGADLTQMTPHTREIYTNREVIAIDQDALGAGAELVSRTTPDTEVWQRSLGSRTGDEVAVLMLNASDRPTAMQVSWAELHLLSGARARDVWSHRDLAAGQGYSATVAAHTAVLLRVHGTRFWGQGTVFEAETPSNIRLGNAALYPCGECSSGYALQLGGGNQPGGVRFARIHADKSGTYDLQLIYVRNGLEDKMVSITVNQDRAQVVRAIMRSFNAMTIPVHLQAGDNSIVVSYTGTLGFDLDRITLSQSVSRQN